MTAEALEKLIDERIRAALIGADTKVSPWAEEELRSAVANGITDGTRPGGYATREEAAIMVERLWKRLQG